MKKFPIALVTAVGLVAAGCGLAAEEVVLEPDANREIVIDMGEFGFGADLIEVTAGETVTFVLVNNGDNEHEFMIGRNLQKTDLGYPNGFEHDFFEDGPPLVDPPSAGMDMAAMAEGDMAGMDMSGDAASGDGAMSDEEMANMDNGDGAMSDEEMANMDNGDGGADEGIHAGFMVQRRPGEVARLTVTIPEEAVGEWDIGCFRGLGSHWDAGMRSVLMVKAA